MSISRPFCYVCKKCNALFKDNHFHCARSTRSVNILTSWFWNEIFLWSYRNTRAQNWIGLACRDTGYIWQLILFTNCVSRSRPFSDSLVNLFRLFYQKQYLWQSKTYKTIFCCIKIDLFMLELKISTGHVIFSDICHIYPNPYRIESHMALSYLAPQWHCVSRCFDVQ